MRDTIAARPITRREIEEAMEEFFDKGGKIQVLPPQIFIQKFVVGDNQLMAYEDPDTIILHR